jgi:predicted phosphate transport protein (TIGR00153 family)
MRPQPLKLFQFGKDLAIFNLLDQQAQTAVQAAKTFHTLVKNYEQLPEYAEQIDAIEHRADNLRHEVDQKVDSSFVTPMDKEDLHAISTSIDDVTDSIEAIADTLMMYRLPNLQPDIEPLALLLVQTMEATEQVVHCLRNMSGRQALEPLVAQINQLENQGDTIYRRAIGDLFHSPARDPFLFVAWKEVYDRIETAIDDCERVGNLIEGMVVKYA